MTTHEDSGTGHLRPRITLTAADHERLSFLARAAMNRMPAVATSLADEIDRAQVLTNGQQPVDVVCMGSEVEFRDDATGKVQKGTLVYPDEADISKGKISVLTPIGAALIGVSAGRAITWETPRGDVRRLTVLRANAPEPT